MSGLNLTASALAAMVLGCAVVGALGQVAVARAGADSSADLAALSAAARLVRGEPGEAACTVAAQVADPHPLRGCDVDGQTVVVTVVVPVRVLAWTGAVTGRARAGPVTAPMPP